MKEHPTRRLRLAFEPNRFAAEQLVKVYEELKPLESRTTAVPSSPKLTSGKHPSVKRGGQ